MNGICTGIAIAFLAYWTVVVANNDQNRWEYDPYDCLLDQKTGKIPIKCPLKEKDNHTTTNIAHETDCTKFYKCFLGRGVLQKCPMMNKYERLHYNRCKQVCDWPWQAGCNSCLEKDKNGYCPEFNFPNKKDNCKSYFHCTKNCKQESKTCPKDTCFSRTCQKCVKNRNCGNCGDKDEKGCKYDGREYKEGDRRIHECDCPRYYECESDESGQKKWIEKRCQDGLHFSILGGCCDDPDRAKCPYL